MTLNLTQLKDVAERAIMTYLQAVIGLWLASGITDMSMSAATTLAVAAAPGALSILKGYLASVLPIGDATGSVVRTQAPQSESELDE